MSTVYWHLRNKFWSQYLFWILYFETVPNMNVTAADTSAVNSTESVTIKISEANREQFNVMQILQLLLVSVGIIGNLTVIIVFMNHRKLRRKIPNRFIVNQVSQFYVTRDSICHSWFGINKYCLVPSNKPDN